ncbi:MAG: hypothetical protein R3F30_16590 [Planctomycetota bacterium]
MISDAGGPVVAVDEGGDLLAELLDAALDLAGFIPAPIIVSLSSMRGSTKMSQRCWSPLKL